MKKILKLLLLSALVLVQLEGWAQTPPTDCAPRVINTLPSTAFNSRDADKLNKGFDWTLQQFKIFADNIDPNNYSPFYQGDNVSVAHLLASPDNKNGDGWEVMKYSLGYDLNGLNPVKDGNPYFILYNKYTGLLRVFVAIANRQADYNSASFRIEFLDPTNHTSLLSLGGGLMALDMDDPTPGMNSISAFNNDVGKWFLGELVMTYDPCTCLFTNSKIKIDVDLIEKASITLDGTVKGNLTPDEQSTVASGDAKNVSVNQKSSNLMLGLDGKKIFEGVKAGVETFKSLDEWKNKQFEAIEDKTISTPTSPTATKKDALNFLQTALKNTKFLRQGLKAVPYIGAAVSVLDMFIGGGDEAEKPTGPSLVTVTPMSISMNASFKGNITTTNNFKQIIFYTPGSNVPSTTDWKAYPLYNKTMGTVNLLETPKVYASHYGYHSYTKISTNQYGYDAQDQYYDNVQYKLMEPLKLTINKDAGLDETDVEVMAALVFEGDNTPRKMVAPYKEVEPLTPLGFTRFQDNATKDNWTQYRTNYYSVANLQQNVIATFRSRYQTRTRTFDTYYHFEPTVVGGWGVNTTTYQIPEKVFVKIIVSMKRKDAASKPDAQNVLFVGKFPVDLQSDNLAPNDQDIPLNTHTQYGTTGSGSLDNSIDSKTVASSDDFQSSNGATVLNTLTISNTIVNTDNYLGTYGNYSEDYKVIAGEIFIESETDLSGEIDLSIGAGVNNNELRYPVTSDNDIYTFCNSTYKTKRSPTFSFRIAENEALSDDIIETSETSEITLFPNPASNSATLRYSLQGEATVKAYIADIYGTKSVDVLSESIQTKGSYEVLANTASLTSGTYFLIFENNGVRIAQRLMIVK